MQSSKPLDSLHRPRNGLDDEAAGTFVIARPEMRAAGSVFGRDLYAFARCPLLPSPNRALDVALPRTSGMLQTADFCTHACFFTHKCLFNSTQHTTDVFQALGEVLSIIQGRDINATFPFNCFRPTSPTAWKPKLCSPVLR